MNDLTSLPPIAVIGCGHWGKNLIRNFHQLGALRGIFDQHRETMERQRAQYSGVLAFASYEEALAHPEIRGVALATPAEQHARMAIQALEAGKDVFVEKPLALTVPSGQAMVDAARSAGRLLMTGHLLIYHPAVITVRKLVESGEIGNLEYIYSNRLSMGKVRREENALWSFAPHDISVILALTGRMPIQAGATGGAYLQPNIADVTMSTLLFEQGTRAHIFVSWLHPYKEQRLVVVGSRKMIVFEDSRPDNKLLLYDKQVEWGRDGAITVSQAKAEPVPYPNDEPLREECRHFLECIAKRQTPRTPGEDGVRVLEVLAACQRSLELNGEPVRLGTELAMA